MRVASCGGAASRAACTSAAIANESSRSPFARRRRDLDHLVPALLELRTHQLGQLAALGDVDLVEGHDARPLGEWHGGAGGVGVNRVRRELGLDHFEVGDGVAVRFERGAVDHVHQRGAAFHVAQELETQPLALAGARDQARHVGDGEADVAGLHDPEVRHQRRERVVRDLRTGGRQHRDQARLAGAGEADQCHVRDRLELEDDVVGPAGLAEEREAGRLAPCGRECCVAEPTATALGHDEARAGTDQVGDDVAVGVLDDGAAGDAQLEILAIAAVPHVPLTRCTVAAAAVRGVVVLQQGRRGRVDHQDHVAAASAVRAVGAPERLELLTMDRGAAVAAVTARHVQHHPVDEARHRCCLLAVPNEWNLVESLVKSIVERVKG